MLSAGEILQLSQEYLEKGGVENPRLDAELLLGWVIGTDRVGLYSDLKRPFTEGELSQLRELVKRRRKREPLSYIIEKKEFYSRDFLLRRGVFIPRPETEVLVDEVIEELRTKINFTKLLDIGTGCGNIAIILALENSSISVVGTDISSLSIKLAKLNAMKHGVASRVNFLCGDMFSALSSKAKFDLIVSNPPYIPSREIERLMPEIKNYEPRMAIDGGRDGFDVISKIFTESREYLTRGARVIFEIGDGQLKAIKKIAQSCNFSVLRVRNDYSKVPRVVVCAVKD